MKNRTLIIIFILTTILFYKKIDKTYHIYQNDLYFNFYELKKNHEVFIYKHINKSELRFLVINTSKPQKNSKSVILFHGGGWYRGSISQLYQLAKYFANMGYQSIIPEYRVKLRHGTDAIASNTDIQDFKNYIISNREHLGIDFNQLFLIGTSGGAQLAISTIINNNDSIWVPRAMAFFAPTLDLSLQKYTMFNNLNEKYSPIHNTEKINCPVLIYQGMKDKSVNYKTTQRFCDSLIENGNSCILKLYPEANHEYFESGNSENEVYLSYCINILNFFNNSEN